MQASQDGILTTWNDDRGFGFITASSRTRYFVHISAFGRPVLRPEQGDLVSFTPGTDAHGRLQATRVDGVGGRVRSRRPASLTYGWIIALVIGLAVAIQFGTAPLWVVAVYAGMSALTFAVYAIDKSSARRGGRRQPEQLLHTLELFGGWPGGLLAQQWLHHKSAKKSYLTSFWVMVGLNVATLVVISLPGIRDWLLPS